MTKRKFDLDPLVEVMGNAMDQLGELKSRETKVLLLSPLELRTLQQIYQDWLDGKSINDMDAWLREHMQGDIEDVGLILTGEGGD